MNVEEMYTTLRGASGGAGAKYDVVQKWFEISKIIDGRFITREFFTESYERLCPNREELSLVQFVQLVGILMRKSKLDEDAILARFAKIIDGVKVTEANARKLFDDCKDKQNVELEKFKQAISSLAGEQKKKAEEMTATLAAEGSKFLGAVASAAAAAAAAATGAAAAAFKDAMDKK